MRSPDWKSALRLFTILNARLKLANDWLCLIERSNLFQLFEAKFVEDQCPQFLLVALLRIFLPAQCYVQFELFISISSLLSPTSTCTMTLWRLNKGCMYKQ